MRPPEAAVKAEADADFDRLLFRGTKTNAEMSRAFGFPVTEATTERLAISFAVKTTVTGSLTQAHADAYAESLTRAEKAALRMQERIAAAGLPNEYRQAVASHGPRSQEDALRAAVEFAKTDLPSTYRMAVAGALRGPVDEAQTAFSTFAAVGPAMAAQERQAARERTSGRRREGSG